MIFILAPRLQGAEHGVAMRRPVGVHRTQRAIHTQGAYGNKRWTPALKRLHRL